MNGQQLTFTRKEAAAQLGVCLPILDSWINRAEHPIPVIRAARRVIIPAQSLQAWLEDETRRNSGSKAASGR